MPCWGPFKASCDVPAGPLRRLAQNCPFEPFPRGASIWYLTYVVSPHPCGQAENCLYERGLYLQPATIKEGDPMIRKLGLVSVSVVAALLCYVPYVRAQVNGGARIVQAVDESSRLALTGNVRPEARPENDRGRVADSVPMEHMLLQLRRSPERETALQQFLDELQTKSSPNFHQWLTAQEFGTRYGV